jgi:hypothetical protein
MAAPAIIGLTRSARADTRTLKISHQFPGSSATPAIFATAFAASLPRKSRSAARVR